MLLCRRVGQTSNMTSNHGLNSRIVDYITRHGDNLAFTDAFWKRCEPHNKELERYSKYVQVLTCYRDGVKTGRISSITNVNGYSVSAWSSFRQKPKLGHYLSKYLELGPPKQGCKWLSLNNTSGHAIPLGPFVQVPIEIKQWKDVECVLSSLTPPESVSPPYSREYLFGFLLGVVIGDAAKKRQQKWHRHLELTLSRRYGTSERIGDFTCVCARAIGLRMRRMPDRPKYNDKPNDFFVWSSQSSALVDWIFNCSLGLEDQELTTYNAVKMNWALEGPDDFRKGLIQGMAESDGSVNISGQEVEFWIGPSWDFVKALLKTFGIESFRSREALAISKSQVTKALGVPIFAPQLETTRYQKFVRLAMAKHIERGKRIPTMIRNEILVLAGSGMSIPAISERILEKFGTILTYEALQRWATRGPKRL